MSIRKLIPIIVLLSLALLIFASASFAVDKSQVEKLLSDTQILMDITGQEAAADPASTKEDLEYFKQNEGEVAPDVAGNIDSALYNEGVDPDGVKLKNEGNVAESTPTWMWILMIVGGILGVNLLALGGVVGYKKLKGRKKGEIPEADELKNKEQLSDKNLMIAQEFAKKETSKEQIESIKSKAEMYLKIIDVLKKNFPPGLFTFKEEAVKEGFEAKKKQIKEDYPNVEAVKTFFASFRETFVRHSDDPKKYALDKYDFRPECERFAELSVKQGKFMEHIAALPKILELLRKIVVREEKDITEFLSKAPEADKPNLIKLETLLKQENNLLDKMEADLKGIKKIKGGVMLEDEIKVVQAYITSASELKRTVAAELVLRQQIPSLLNKGKININGKFIIEEHYNSIVAIAKQFELKPEELLPKEAITEQDGHIHALVFDNKEIKTKDKKLSIPDRLTDLKFLSCFNCKLEKLVLPKGLMDLQTLNCANNQLKALDIPKNLDKLEKLVCDDNPELVLNIYPEMKSLKDVSCKNTKIPPPLYAALSKHGVKVKTHQ